MKKVFRIKKISSFPLKFDLKVRIATFLLITTLFQLHANESYSQKTKITLNLENVSLEKALNKIESLTEFKFFYNDDVIDYKFIISISAERKRVSAILSKLLSDTDITYKIVGKQIVLVKDSIKINKEAIPIEKIDQPIDQQLEIIGVVKDSKGIPLAGVNIVIEGTNKGTNTDFDGNYNIEANTGDVLVFSYLGMIGKNITVGTDTTINVTLIEDTNFLDEVVIVGYGSTTKRKMSSAITTISTEEISDAPYTNVADGLTGRTAGVFTLSGGGAYGDLPTISIRGGGEPTYVIDGIISDKEEFAHLPPNDIDKISILKDAASAAVYGFDAANGIVLVTTKQGARGKFKVNYSSDFSWQQLNVIPEYMSSYEYALATNAAAFTDGTPQPIDDETLNIIQNNLDPTRYTNGSFNRFDEALKKNTPQQRHSISLSGTTGETRIYLSADFLNQDGMYKIGNWGLERNSFRTNISQGFKNTGLTVEGNISVKTQKKTSPASDYYFWSHLFTYSPLDPLYNSEGNYYGQKNPLAKADPSAGYTNEEDNFVNTRLALIWDVPGVTGLQLKAIGNYKYYHEFNKSWNANQSESAQTYDFNNLPDNMGDASLYEYTSRKTVTDFEAHVNYATTILDKHNLELTGVIAKTETNLDWFNASNNDFISGAVDQLFAGAQDGKDNDGSQAKIGRIGYIGRLKYSYDDKYILESNFRYDGNDNFPDGKRYGLFPSVSVAWNMDKEAFLKPFLNTINMNYLKLRASWGVLGNNGSKANDYVRFPSIAGYNLRSNAYYIDETFVTGFREGDLVSQNVTWSENETKNIGIDFGFNGSKFSGSFDWFYTRATGFTARPTDTYTTTLGKSLPYVNTDSAFRKGGGEFAVAYKTAIGEAKFNINGNISYYDQLWEKKYDESESSLMNPYTRLTGETDYYTSGYTDLGLYQNLDDILNNPRYTSATGTQPGDIQYQDFNGDGIINSDDRTRIGKSRFPHVLYGLGVGVNYKGFNFNALIQGTADVQLEFSNLIYQYDKIFLDSWSSTNTNSLYPRRSSSNSTNGSNNSQTSTYNIIDAWYVRLKSVKLSYDLKYKFLKNVDALDNVTLLLSATNLFTVSPLTKYNVDPETDDSRSWSYPNPKTLNLGIRVGF